MSDKIRIWKVSNGGIENAIAEPLDEIFSSETEQRLEELLVASPDLLMDGLRLIGRQLPTDGGPLDLLGIDPGGRLAIFELKRGTLTREAVAQILDYASDLIARDPDDFARVIETNSGRHGIPTFDDFGDWFQREFPSATEAPPGDPRLVLVGLGVDERAKRIVNFLANSGVDVQLLTFQAFRSGSETLLARRVETVEPSSGRAGSVGGTKEGNRQILFKLAQEQGVEDLLREISDYVDEHLPAYRWPGKTSFTFSLQERTEQGRPTSRAYAHLWVDQRSKGTVLFTLPELTVNAAPELIADALEALPAARRTETSWTPFELPITALTWPEIRDALRNLLEGVERVWKNRVAAQDVDDSAET